MGDQIFSAADRSVGGRPERTGKRFTLIDVYASLAAPGTVRINWPACDRCRTPI
jgi:hypothetical protein